MSAQNGFEHQLDKLPGVARLVGEGESEPLKLLQDQENIQETGEDEGRGRLCRLTVFIRHENVVRLLEFLWYRHEE